MDNNNFENKAKQIFNDVKDETEKFDKKDIESGKGMAVLSYIGILSLIPYFSEKDNKYVMYHAKQGVNLFIIDIIVGIALGIIGSILIWRLYWLASIINSVVGLFMFALSIIGIVNVCNGKAKELPVINKFKIIK